MRYPGVLFSSERIVSGNVEYNSAESWDFARRFAGLFGTVPSSFTSTIRGVLADWERTKAISNGNKFLLLRLLKTASIKAPVYYAAATYKSESIESGDYIPPEGFLKFFTPQDICSMLGLVYLYRRAKRLCAEEEWAFVGGVTQTQVDLGGCLGFSIPAIGGTVGILGLGLWQLAYAAFLIHDQKGFVEHRRNLKQRKLFRDEEMEMARWGCCAYQIATVMAQSLGFGVQFSDVMTRGFSPENRRNGALDKEAYRFAIATVWMEALQNTGKIPNIAHKGEFYPSKGTVQLLEEVAPRIQQEGSSFNWLDRSKNDVSPDLTPALYSAEELSAAGNEEGQDVDEILAESAE